MDFKFQHYKALATKIFPDLSEEISRSDDSMELCLLIQSRLRDFPTVQDSGTLGFDLFSLTHATRGYISGEFVWRE